MRAITSSKLACIAVLLLAAAPLWGAVGDVQGVGFDSKDGLVWNPVPGAAGYHVYRGVVAALPGDAECLLGSVLATVATVGEDPAAGTAWYYLVSAFDDVAEGTYGADSNMIARSVTTVCVPSRRSFSLDPNGPAADSVIDGQEPRRNASGETWSSDRETTGVYRHTGEFFLRTTDFDIPGRGLDFRFTRKYRSQIAYDGPLGHGWDSNLNARLVDTGSDVIYHDGSGRRERFFRVDSTHFTSPPGLYTVLKENGDGSFTLRWPDGELHNFHGLDFSNLHGVLESIEDRVGATTLGVLDGNYLRLLYDHQGLLDTVVDTMGRNIDFGYDGNGRLTSVTDYAGRSWIYSYDGNGDLVAGRSPTVTGTPNGNDFASGKTTLYGYSDHNLLTVTAPNEQAVAGPALLINVYGTTPATVEFDRVISQTIGGTNASAVPAGGTLSYSYVQLNVAGDPLDRTLPRRESTVTDRNGNLRAYTHNFDGNLISRLEATNRNVRVGEGDYTTGYVYNVDGEIEELTLPEGNRIVYTYDGSGLDRYRAGNVLEVHHIADVTRGGDGNGSSIADLTYLGVYEPVFNRLVSVVEPRGNDPAYVPQNGGAHSAARYTTNYTYDFQEADPVTNGISAYAAEFDIDLSTGTFGLGDQNEDVVTNQAYGNLVRTDEPSALLVPEFANQAVIEFPDTSQEIATLQQWNALGQLTLSIDAERNRHTYAYHAEDDPDGDGNPSALPADGRTLDGSTGGYLATTVVDQSSETGRNNGLDPAPVTITEEFVYDPVGNPTHRIDGRGVLARRLFNALDQIVQLRRAAATADDSGPDGDPATGRLEELGLTAHSFKTHYEYDANDNLVATRVEDRGLDRGAGPEVDTTYTFDILDRPVSVGQEATTLLSLTTEYRYDANENLDEVTSPEGNQSTGVYDERDLLYQRTRGAAGPRTGTPSTESYDYDGNRNIVTTTDGRLHPLLTCYDGFDRPVRTLDQLGHTKQRFYDPANNVVREIWNEIAGPASDCTTASGVQLARTDYLYDEQGRRFGEDRELFAPGGLARPAQVQEGTLRPGDGFVNRRFEYDRLSRLTFVVEDTEATTRFDYDGASRQIEVTLPDGNSTVESFFDDAGNRIERIQTEASSTLGPADEQFVTTWFHDALSRRIQRVDPYDSATNLARSWRREYDSLDELVAISDPRGPNSGTVDRRSPGLIGNPVATNGHGNVTRYTHDGAGRRTTVEHVLTASGEGDGTINPTPDVTQGGGDGLVTLTTTWDDNSLATSNADDRTNITSYGYDNLDRRLTVTADDGTVTAYQYDANDNLEQETDANGSILVHTYDDADRRTRTDITPAQDVVGTAVQTFQYDGLDRLTLAFDDNTPGGGNTADDVTVRVFYDSLSRVVEERQQVGPLPAGAANTDYEWLGAGRLTRLVYPDGRQIDYGYDTADRLVTVDDADGGRPESAGFDYFGMTRVHSIARNNSVTSTTLDNAGSLDPGYDGLKRVVQLRHLDSLNAPLAGFEYGYDRADNLTSERRQHHPIGPNLKGELYGYDALDRLVSFDEGPLDSSLLLAGPADDVQDWTLDGASNWVGMTRNAAVSTSTPNNLNEYDENQSGGNRTDDGTADDFRAGTAAARNHAHDKQGNLTENDDGNPGSEDLFAYDALDRLVSIGRNGSPIAAYTYDALGRRVTREVTNRGVLNEERRYLYASLAPPKISFTTGTMDEAADVVSSIEITGFLRPSTGFTSGTMDDATDLVSSIEITGFLRPSSRFTTGTMDDMLRPRRYRIIEERDGVGATVRQLIATDVALKRPRSAFARLLWQVIDDGSLSTNHLLTDRRGSTVAVTPGATDTVDERVTYDAYGTPTFEDAANDKLCNDATPNKCPLTVGPYLAQSTVGNDELYRGMRYDPETAVRTRVPATDYSGLYATRDRYLNPDEGRYLSRADADCRGDLDRLGNGYSETEPLEVPDAGVEEGECGSTDDDVADDGEPVREATSRSEWVLVCYDQSGELILEVGQEYGTVYTDNRDCLEDSDGPLPGTLMYCYYYRKCPRCRGSAMRTLTSGTGDTTVDTDE